MDLYYKAYNETVFLYRDVGISGRGRGEGGGGGQKKETL